LEYGIVVHVYGAVWQRPKKLPFVSREEAHSSISISKAGTLFSEIYLFDKEACQHALDAYQPDCVLCLSLAELAILFNRCAKFVTIGLG
jgi:hypothetical protein